MNEIIEPEAVQASPAGQSTAEEKPRLRDYGISLLALLILLISAGVGVSVGHFEDVLDFSKQTWSFVILTVGIIAIGFNLGQVNYRKKKIWAASDLLWISFAVLGLSGMLAPIENYVTANEITGSAAIADVHYNGLVRKTGIAKDRACAATDTAACNGWTRFASVVLSPGVTLNNIVERVDEALPQVPKQAATEKIRAEIQWSRNALRNAIANGNAARSVASAVNIGWSYFTLGLFIAALGFRAGRTGAEFAKLKNEDK
ncbi:hypothetical protein NM04_09000 [Massilia aurea]|uniref:Uncharacterized protein n=1 Tax=Massilia aurea TaxID=373040 RepID=A0A422QMD5_9BURK|nr:hypothetical protein [Massilia aurea]RNF31113.1 hypothetical protein NM04_09000 [Massilia aurea]